jgi:hypothetical protein
MTSALMTKENPIEIVIGPGPIGAEHLSGLKKSVVFASIKS